MKKAFLTVLMLGAIGMVNAQVIYSEDFNSATPNLMPAGMTEVNNDGSTEPAALAALNFDDHGWVTYKFATSPQDIVAISYSYQTPEADDWMITPAITLDGDCKISWKGKIDYAAPNNDGYEVRVSTTNTDLASFTNVVFSIDGEIPTGAFEPHSADLSAFAGQTVYIAFRNNTKSRTYLVIDDIVVEKYTPATDLGLVSLNMQQYVPTPDNGAVTGSVENFGTKAITAFKVNYTVNGGSVQSETVSATVYAGTTYDFTLSSTLNRSTDGTFKVKAWVSEVNGGTGDTDSANDTIEQGFYSYSGATPSKRVVIEEATGTWCVWCPRGSVFMDSIHNVEGANTVLIAVHNNDPMVNTAYDTGIRGLITGYPSALVDRQKLIDPSEVFTEFDKAINDFGLAEMTFTANYDAGTKRITGNVSALFAAPADGDFRVAMVITEDKVKGTGTTYNQANNYAGGAYGPMGGYETKPNPVPAAQMVYDFVAREIVGGFDGQAGSLPALIGAGSTQTYALTSSVIPTTYKPANLRAHILLIDAKNNKIYNAKSAAITGFTGVSEVEAVKISDIVTFPNPVVNELNVNFNLAETAAVNVSVVNSVGQTVAVIPAANMTAGAQKVTINTSEFAAGTYFVQIGTSKGVVSEAFVKH